MKKILISLFALTSLVFMGCDLFINEVEVHNGLVSNVDSVAIAEEAFYDEYWALAEDGDTTVFLESFDTFKVAVKGLDDYMEITEFSTTQQPMVKKYYDSYKPIAQGYIGIAEEFALEVESNGYNFEDLESYFVELDGYTLDFVSADDTFSELINTLANITNR